MTGLLVIVTAIGLLWPVFAVAGGVWAVWRLIVGQADRTDARLRAESTEHAALGRRADEQNQLAIAGDPRGIHGKWPPVEPNDVAVRPI